MSDSTSDSGTSNVSPHVRLGVGVRCLLLMSFVISPLGGVQPRCSRGFLFFQHRLPLPVSRRALGKDLFKRNVPTHIWMFLERYFRTLLSKFVGTLKPDILMPSSL